MSGQNRWEEKNKKGGGGGTEGKGGGHTGFGEPAKKIITGCGPAAKKKRDN